MNIVDLKFVPQGTPDLNIQAFDCGRKSVNKFFRDLLLGTSPLQHRYGKTGANSVRNGTRGRF